MKCIKKIVVSLWMSYFINPIDFIHLFKLFHIDVEGITWNLIHSLHKKTQTVIRWCGETSEPFEPEIQQGLRQGGVLSTDLYKVYSNPLLDRVTSLLIGGMVGEI